MVCKVAVELGWVFFRMVYQGSPGLSRGDLNWTFFANSSKVVAQRKSESIGIIELVVRLKSETGFSEFSFSFQAHRESCDRPVPRLHHVYLALWKWIDPIIDFRAHV